MHIDAALPDCGTDHEPGLPHRGKNRVSITGVEKPSAFAGVLEGCDRIGIIRGVRDTHDEKRRTHHSQRRDGSRKPDVIHDEKSL
jgi:hypothetical protein